MNELFEFSVTRKEEFSFSDKEVNQLMTDFLEPRGLFWGGGGSSNSIHGVVSIRGSIEVNLLLDEFISFFNDTDSIVVRLIADSGNRSRLAQLKQHRNVTFEPYTADLVSD